MSKPSSGRKAFQGKRRAQLSRLVGSKRADRIDFHRSLALLPPSTHSDAESPENTKYTENLQTFSILSSPRVCNKIGSHPSVAMSCVYRANGEIAEGSARTPRKRYPPTTWSRDAENSVASIIAATPPGPRWKDDRPKPVAEVNDEHPD